MIVLQRLFWFCLIFPFAAAEFGSGQQPDSSSVEWIEVYFNMPSDTTVAKTGNRANDKADLIATLTNLLDEAEYSIDLAAYDLEHHQVGKALADAAERGVRVRVVTDNYNRFDSREIDEAMWEILREAGIYSLDDAGDVFHPDGSVTSRPLPGGSYDMHHKFAVVDIMSPDPDDYYVWTGSTNLTYTGSYNSNNSIVIKDNEVALAYSQEFNQMWGGDGDEPGPAKARFHRNKNFTGKNIFFIGDTKTEIYFGPVNHEGTNPSIATRLEELILEYAGHDINFLAFAITPEIPMSRAMWERSAKEDILLRGIIDPSFYARYKNQEAIWGVPEAQMGNRNILPAREMRKLHHKVLLLDTGSPFENSRGIAVSGSYNFSANAEQNNDENLLIFHCDLLANQYYQDFMGTMKRASGEHESPVPALRKEEWYDVAGVYDGSRFEIELVPGFTYPVRFLGVQVPEIYAGADSSEYYSAEAAEFLSNFLEGKQVRLKGVSQSDPEAHYGAYRGYIQVKDPYGTIKDVNYEVLKNGFGEWTEYFWQHPDSVLAYQRYTAEAKEAGIGMWKEQERVGEKIARTEPGRGADGVMVLFPVNINTADETVLQALPGIGPAYAARIIQYRIDNGGFDSVEDLVNVSGIGAVTMNRLRPNVTVE
ncbi:MAG: phospholipase D-like domain-containing protein [Balneolaceae bacterium]